ncbi:MAG: sigma-54-dependent transcriptional regulator [Methylophilaceae bacterium]|jgi:two-component system response regulator PilR (NtrC family)|uniref:sigma-54-dependent transcriptional regulator n=1 Tax=Methylobacillus sp. MM3 TaxID=1848039 RepID=UPI0007DFDD05|nr:sigma-54 dependent transcriptional regulator [Methylobacillus sp. MM3]OAJ70673.1 sigma-54-dependent Fis family transcriptional regulator [Methylobacillus sp. MM3]
MPDFPATASCLVVDDEADIRELLVLTLERMGLSVECASDVAEAQRKLEQREFALCLTDMRLPDGDGLELMRHIFQHRPGMPVAVITAYGSAENAVAALKAGAFDYLSKPISLKQLRPLVQSALKLSERAEPRTAGLALIGDSAPIRQARQMIDKLARSQAPVYISGESGSGKELAARLIHANSVRCEGPFVPVNCGAIPENLMESEFFGYKKGAFTGALQDREGFFQAASGGTLFLDEVADLPLPMQVKLLRAIQEKKVRMVGSTQEENVDVRIISATHRNLSQMMENGLFRQDLYYRLNVIELRMPPLREMAEDIPQLAANILEKHCRELGTAIPRLSEPAAMALIRHGFPGNVRELENVLERALALCDGSAIESGDLLLEASASPVEDVEFAHDGEIPLPEYLESIERKIILDALEKTGNNKTAAAKLLGVSFRTLRYRLERLNLGKD